MIKALFTLCLMLLAAVAVPAQTEKTVRVGELSAKLFPQPTGMNGFEELVLAGEIAGASRSLVHATEPGATLSRKRLAMADPEIGRALKLMRTGLLKPRVAPRDSRGDPPFELYGPIRQLGRLITVEMSVRLADGRVNLAIDSLRDALRLGYAMQSDLIIGGLVGVAINAMAVKVLQDHVGRLSERDCRQLQALAVEWIGLPDPAITSLETERQFVLKRLREQLSGSGGLYNEVAPLLSARIEAITASLRLPYWERKPLPPLGDSNPEKFVTALGLETVYASAQKSFTRDLAAVQVLGVHAAIRRHLWEYNTLPAGLDELKLGRMALDPFTGQPLRYTRLSDRTYDLVSEGAEASRTPTPSL